MLDSMTTRSRVPFAAAFGSGTVRDSAAILLTALLTAIIVRPFSDVPFIDDWAYAWPVQHLLNTGEFLFPEVVLNPIPTQVVWGALFSLPFGFSLTALQISTWVLGVLAVLALYLLVRECGGTRSAAVMAAAVLGYYPIFFVLAPTFMTDVPFLAAMTWSAWLFVRALNRRSVRLVWLAAAVCAASVGIRVIGVGVAAAMVATLLFHTGAWGRRALVLLPPALVGPCAVGLFYWTRTRTFVSADLTWVETSPDYRLEALQHGLDLLPRMLLSAVLFAIVLSGIALLPLAAGMLRRAITLRCAGLLVALGAAWLAANTAGVAAIPFQPGYIWSFRELGATAPLVPAWRADALPAWVAASGVSAALASAAILGAAWPRGVLREGEKFLTWTLVAHVVLVALLWLTYDRYALVFVPLAAALALGRRPIQRAPPTGVCVAAYAALSMIGMHDHLSYTRALWSAVADLRAQGVAPAEIDGGYVVNGWQQYLHPEDAYRDPSGRIVVPMLNGVAELTFVVADRPMPDRLVVRTYPYTNWLRPAGRIYVLKRGV
jgi:hypothetical protein